VKKTVSRLNTCWNGQHNKSKIKHNHAPGYIKPGTHAIQNEIAKHALATKERPRDIISHFLSGENVHLSHKLPRILALLDLIKKLEK
jgi:hypothetical protein